jgi:hypothetical protein
MPRVLKEPVSRGVSWESGEHNETGKAVLGEGELPAGILIQFKCMKKSKKAMIFWRIRDSTCTRFYGSKKTWSCLLCCLRIVGLVHLGYHFYHKESYPKRIHEKRHCEGHAPMLIYNKTCIENNGIIAWHFGTVIELLIGKDSSVSKRSTVWRRKWLLLRHYG